jgi:hypothetical protein
MNRPGEKKDAVLAPAGVRAKAALRGSIEKPINPDTFANEIGKHLEARPSGEGGQP